MTELITPPRWVVFLSVPKTHRFLGIFSTKDLATAFMDDVVYCCESRSGGEICIIEAPGVIPGIDFEAKVDTAQLKSALKVCFRHTYISEDK